MVGSGNGASKWVEMLIGHVWGGQVEGTTMPNTEKYKNITRLDNGHTSRPRLTQVKTSRVHLDVFIWRESLDMLQKALLMFLFTCGSRLW